jgi:hypothetical protein
MLLEQYYQMHRELYQMEVDALKRQQLEQLEEWGATVKLEDLVNTMHECAQREPDTPRVVTGHPPGVVP